MAGAGRSAARVQTAPDAPAPSMFLPREPVNIFLVVILESRRVKPLAVAMLRVARGARVFIYRQGRWSVLYLMG